MSHEYLYTVSHSIISFPFQSHSAEQPNLQTLHVVDECKGLRVWEPCLESLGLSQNEGLVQRLVFVVGSTLGNGQAQPGTAAG